MIDREVLIKAWLAAEHAAVAAERAVAIAQSPTKAELDELVESATSRRSDAEAIFKQVYAAVKDDARP